MKTTIIAADPESKLHLHGAPPEPGAAGANLREKLLAILHDHPQIMQLDLWLQPARRGEKEPGSRATGRIEIRGPEQVTLTEDGEIHAVLDRLIGRLDQRIARRSARRKPAATPLPPGATGTAPAKTG